MSLDESQLVALIAASEPELVALGRSVAGEQARAFDVLSQFLKARRGDLDALDVAAGVVRGIASVAPLEPHRNIYRDLLGADLDPETIRPQPIKTLVLSLAIPGQDSWVRLHGRRLLRRLWELRTKRGFAPDVTLALEQADVAWELSELASLDEAWAVAIAMCTTDDSDVVPAGGLLNVWELMQGGTAIAGDAALAGFLRTHPRVFETAVLERIDELAATVGRFRNSVLDNLFEGGAGFGTSPWAATHAAWNAELGMRVFAQAQMRRLFGPTTTHNSFTTATSWLRRDPDGYAGLPREMVDAFHALIDGSPLPDILPAELEQQSPDQIEQALANYCGITVEQLYGRLLPNPPYNTGFIQPNTSLGWVIKQDAETLRSLGISRHELATRIAELIPSPDQEWHRDGAFQTWAVAFMGHQQDPFHTYDVYSLNGNLGSLDFRIARDGHEIAGGNLQLSLIRRACFFGGPGCYRIDPAVAVELLQLR